MIKAHQFQAIEKEESDESVISHLKNVILQELVNFSSLTNSTILNPLKISQSSALHSQPYIKEAWKVVAVYSGEIYVCCMLTKPRKTNYAPICTLQALNSSGTISVSKVLYKYDYPCSQILRSYLRRVSSV